MATPDRESYTVGNEMEMTALRVWYEETYYQLRYSLKLVQDYQVNGATRNLFLDLSDEESVLLEHRQFDRNDNAVEWFEKYVLSGEGLISGTGVNYAGNQNDLRDGLSLLPGAAMIDGQVIVAEDMTDPRAVQEAQLQAGLTVAEAALSILI